MTGKTHFKIGILAYVITSAAFDNMDFNILQHQNISIAGMLAAGISALVADGDCEDSKINRSNPITGTAIKVTEYIEKMLRKIIRTMVTFGIGGVLFYFAPFITRLIGKIEFLNIARYAQVIVYGMAILLVILGVIGYKGEWVLKNTPVIGYIYMGTLKLLRKGTKCIKRSFILLIYVGSGMGVMIYNYEHIQDPALYIMGVLLIGTAIFPHRTFLHSPEGLALFSIASVYVLKGVGLEDLFVPIIIGYASHLYLGDIFTSQGVPISSLPLIFQKIGIHTLFKNYRIYNGIFRFLDRRISIPIMCTGSKWGRLFETIYIFALLIISMKLIILMNKSIQII
ncbi:MAG: metal-dependent hydrolase [Thermotaleaceae bacterium]